MTTYISWETALQTVAIAHVVSAVLLIATSYIALAAIETIEKPGDATPLPKWFT